jgi:hypothetical protein
MTRQMLHSLVFSALVGALMPAAASAQTAAEGEATSGSPQRELRGQLGVSVNNPGLQNTVEMTWTWPLSSSRNPLLSGAHVAARVVHAITPALTRLGGWVEYSPLSILDLRAGIDPSASFGTFNTLMSFDAYTDPFDKDARDAVGRRHPQPDLRVPGARQSHPADRHHRRPGVRVDPLPPAEAQPDAGGVALPRRSVEAGTMGRCVRDRLPAGEIDAPGWCRPLPVDAPAAQA